MKYIKFYAVLGFIAVSLLQTVVLQLTSDSDQTLDQNGGSIATFLNQKIRRTLIANPEISDENGLATAFNNERSKLQAALITGPGSEDDFIRAEQALENFRNFIEKYKTIDNMLQNALNDLRDYQNNDENPLETKYMALVLQSSLGQVTNLNDAERILEQYRTFKETNATSGLTTGLPPDYAPYFEEILRILRNHFGMDSPQMANILQQILERPELIKEIYTKLKGVAGKDGWDEEEDEEEEYEDDPIWDILEQLKDIL